METVMIPIDKINISDFNVRAEEPFGDEEDQDLMESIKTFGILQPIIVRQVGDMYELIAGRRRIYSARESGLTEIPCIIKDVHDYEALDISLSENLFRKNLDPVTIGRALKRRMDKSGISLREYARKIGKPASTLSNFLRMNDLSPDMQNEVQSRKVNLTEALKVVRMNLPLDKEMELAMEAREVGSESFKNMLDRIASEQEKRGAPKGLQIVRISWGHDSSEYSALKQFAESEGIDLSEYCQKILTEHIQSKMG